MTQREGRLTGLRRVFGDNTRPFDLACYTFDEPYARIASVLVPLNEMARREFTMDIVVANDELSVLSEDDQKYVVQLLAEFEKRYPALKEYQSLTRADDILRTFLQSKLPSLLRTGKARPYGSTMIL